MKDLNELLELVEKANKAQLSDMIYWFDMMGFYREDRRQQRGYIIACLMNCYTTDKEKYMYHDSIEMQNIILKAMEK